MGFFLVLVILAFLVIFGSLVKNLTIIKSSETSDLLLLSILKNLMSMVLLMNMVILLNLVSLVNLVIL